MQEFAITTSHLAFRKSSNNVLKIGLKVHLANSPYMTEAEITQPPGGLCNTNSFANYNHMFI